jgi:hypothetical protein
MNLKIGDVWLGSLSTLPFHYCTFQLVAESIDDEGTWHILGIKRDMAKGKQLVVDVAYSAIWFDKEGRAFIKPDSDFFNAEFTLYKKSRAKPIALTREQL